MSPTPLECAWLWTVRTPESVIQGIVRPHEPVGWELCVLQDDDLVLRETFFSEDQAREYGEALRRRVEPLWRDAQGIEPRRAG